MECNTVIFEGTADSDVVHTQFSEPEEIPYWSKIGALSTKTCRAVIGPTKDLAVRASHRADFERRELIQIRRDR